MVETMKKLMRAKKICEFYTNAADTNKFSVGYVVGVDDRYFIAESVNHYGKMDGFFCSLLENLVQLQADTKYLANISKLLQYNAQTRNPALKIKGDLLLHALNTAKRKQKICTFELCDSNYDDVIGYIKRIDKENHIIELQRISFDGEQDGMAIIIMNTISQVSYDSLEEQKLEILSHFDGGESKE